MARKTVDKNQMELALPGVLYDLRFLESHAGKRILHDPKTATVELIANAWDAGATEVHITWPRPKGSRKFSIQDTGTGMTAAEFAERWRKLNYNRPAEQGTKVVFPDDVVGEHSTRIAFGRNGIGRWSGFCFGEAYAVDTRKNGLRNSYVVSKGKVEPFEIRRVVADEPTSGHGTLIECADCGQVYLSADDIRGEIGMRFLTDPHFRVTVDGIAVSFEDISDPNIKKLDLAVGNGYSVQLVVIDTQTSDHTMKQHGVAWHVGGRLVGTCSWKGGGTEELIDGRRIAAKRFTFIVRADYLADTEAIKSDWSGFDKDNEQFQQTAQVVYEKVREYLLSVSEEDRKATLARAAEHNRTALQGIGLLGREKWRTFVAQAQAACPSIKENDVLKLSEVVANLEQAESGYSLLHKLSAFGPDQLDELYRFLEDWTIDMAKAVLDEIGQRLKLVEELRLRMADKDTREVQDLQPLFKRGLWIFGPEFETIEYTSNESMTRVVQDLFKREDLTGSRNRPDFVVVPDGTVGLYSYPAYDREGGEIGVARLVVLELKKPGVEIGEEHKSQCWKYVKELYDKGLLQPGVTAVKCFVLGETVDPLEAAPRNEGQSVEIQPMPFPTVLKRAESRLLNLRERVKNAPFLEKHRKAIEQFLAPVDVEPALFAESSV